MRYDLSKMRLLIVFLALLIFIHCDDDDSTRCRSEVDFAFGENTTFTTTEIDSVFALVDVFTNDTTIIPIDTLEVFDSLFVRIPDSLFLADTNVDPILLDTIIVSPGNLLRIDSIFFKEPDTLFLVNIEQVNELQSVDTTRVPEPVSQSETSICVEDLEDDAVDALEEAAEFAKYIIGTWSLTEIEQCEDLEDISSLFSSFNIRFDVLSFSTSELRLSYLTAFGQPLFAPSGTITLSMDQDFTGDVVSGTRDDGKAISFQDLDNNINTDNLTFEIDDLIECGDGGRAERLGRARFKCRRF